MHGLAGWFDLTFMGSQKSVTLSTSPDSPGTHWYQCRLLLREPLAVNRGQSVRGSLTFTANEHFSYQIVLVVELEGAGLPPSRNVISLKDQVLHYLVSCGFVLNYLRFPRSNIATSHSRSRIERQGTVQQYSIVCSISLEI
jgi:hypothetical protein